MTWSFVIRIYSNIFRLFMSENKWLWKTGKSFLSNKIQSSERIKLAEEDDTLITNDEEVAMKLNDFFSNVIMDLKIPRFENFILCQKTYTKLLWKQLLSIKHIRECFSFNTITIEDAIKEVSLLDSSKALQTTGLLLKVIKDNSIFFQNKYAFISINLLIKKNCLKLAD